MAPTKRQINKGFKGFADDSAEFLKPDNTNPFEASPSGVGYNSRFNDSRGYERGAQSQGNDDASFLKPSWTGESDSSTDIYGLVDSINGPGGPMLTGGSALPRTRKSRRDGSR